MIDVLHYGAGNVQSVINALVSLGIEGRIISEPEEVKNSNALIFPGVGHFGFAMKELAQRDLLKPLRALLIDGTVPFLGICLGMQLLYEASEEAPGVQGLGIFSGTVRRFQEGYVPQVGWNDVTPDKEGDLLKKGTAYFVNSYAPMDAPSGATVARTNYYVDFVSAVIRGCIATVQFHPEKSGAYGLSFLKSWIERAAA